MKGCARSCLLWTICWAAASAGFYSYLQQLGVLVPQLYWAAAGAGLCVVFVGGYVLGIVQSARERAMLTGAVTGTPFEDGKWVAVSGTIRAASPLRSPLTGTPCVAYTYDIQERRKTKDGWEHSSIFSGKALTPGTIASRQGSVRLLAVPLFEVPKESVPQEIAMPNAERYIASTTFQSRETSKERRVGVEEEWTDADGSFRLDRRYGGSEEADLHECTFEEQLVRQGDSVCAFGLYSREKGGIVPHPNWAKQTRIMLGDGTAVAGKLRTRIVRYAIGILIFGAAPWGIIELYKRALGR